MAISLLRLAALAVAISVIALALVPVRRHGRGSWVPALGALLAGLALAAVAIAPDLVRPIQNVLGLEGEPLGRLVTLVVIRLFAEEGIVSGAIGVCFAAVTLSWLIRGRGVLAAGILAGRAGYLTMATFDNSFLFTHVSAVVFPLIGFGAVSAARPATRAGIEGATERGPIPPADRSGP